MFSVKAIQEIFMESGTASENMKVRVIMLGKNGIHGEVLFEGVIKELDKFEKSNKYHSGGWLVNSIEREQEYDECGNPKLSDNCTIEIIVF